MLLFLNSRKLIAVYGNEQKRTNAPSTSRLQASDSKRMVEKINYTRHCKEIKTKEQIPSLMHTMNVVKVKKLCSRNAKVIVKFHAYQS